MGVPKDLTKAVEYYQLAVDQGNANAQCNLGVCYERGMGVPKDLTKAVEYYQLAADQGNATAKSNLECLLKATELVNLGIQHTKSPLVSASPTDTPTNTLAEASSTSSTSPTPKPPGF